MAAAVICDQCKKAQPTTKGNRELATWRHVDLIFAPVETNEGREAKRICVDLCSTACATEYLLVVAEKNFTRYAL